MIHYDLRCSGGHEFDGWFRSSAAFDQQANSGLLDCPVCASVEVSRAIMAPRLNRGAAAPVERPQPGQAPVDSAPTASPEQSTPAGPLAQVTSPANPVPVLPPMPDQVRAVLQRIRAEVEQRCDYVGPRFAEAARAIHTGTAPARAIYGETTPDEAEALADDGIEVSRIPWVPRADG